MTQEPTYRMPADQAVNPGPVRRINLTRLWAGGLATALVSSLIVVVGVLVARQVLGTAVLLGKAPNGYADGTVATYALRAGAAALLATVLMNLLLLAVPQPDRFFRWIVGLVAVTAGILPFTMSGPTGPKAASAIINLLVGIAILALLGSIGPACVRRDASRGVEGAPTVG